MNRAITVTTEHGDTPMLYTLGQASKATGKAKGTIKNAIDKGRISARKNEIGEYEIDPSELHRVYSPVTEQSQLNTVIPLTAPPLNTPEINPLEDKVKLLEQTLEDVRKDRDEWRKQAQTLALLPPLKEDRGRVLGFLWKK
ncbi:hypothetical protein OS189_18395 [Sulfitobacter sp. F26169L]|uniref:hypothetical protein n=1 Tax=Sulfitobacter sp. F26169L TaxID=2996015 RepID=UPI00226087CB|nr:hypothetical protein [Sulfitobacter sp. F26169L]MCX7568312.1 hypothetical protein [Sulfitobacter sp. F26169L]